MSSHLERIFPSWLAAGLRLDVASYRRGRNRRRRRLQAVLLPLEDRRLLSTFSVTSTADDGSTGTLRWAVDGANADTSPSTIVFDLGTAPATITLTQGQLELNNTLESVTIDDGTGQGPVTISGNKESGAFQVDSGVTASISDLTIAGGATLESGGHGGGSINDLGTLTLSDCTISNNPLSGYSASGVYVDGTAHITDCTITGGNSSYGSGVDVFKGTADITGSTIDNNTGELNVLGAGVFNGGTTTLVNCTISGNSAGGSGGGLYNSDTGQLKVYGCTISGNTSVNEGAGVSNKGTADLSGCTISGNSNDNSGGGVWNGFGETIDLSGCTISSNSASLGGGLCNDGTATLINCTISQNTAYKGGGVTNGPLHTTAVLTLTGSTISDNNAMMGGGGAFNYGQATLTDSTIANNSVSQGIYPATSNGGGLDDSGTASLVACTISGNSTTGRGGGIYVGGPGTNTVTLHNTIVADNDSAQTGGSASPNDIITGTTGAVVSGSDNLVGIGGSAGLTDGTNGNIVLTSLADLGLAPLGDYGGPTETMALLPGSIAIHGSRAGMEIAAQGSALTTDQRGQPLDTPVPDIGAFQTSQPVSLSFTDLTSPRIAYGSASVTISGILANGNLAPPDTESVQVTLDGITQPAAIGTGGAFSTTFDTSTLSASGSPYSIRYSYMSDGTYASASATGALTVNQATPTVALTASAASAVYGQTVTFTATVTAPGGTPTGTVTFSDGGTTLGTVALNASGMAMLTTSALAVAPHSITATYSGDAGDQGDTSAPVAELVSKAGIEIVLMPQPVFKKKEVESVRLTAEVMPLAPGGAVPTGAVVFELKQKKVKTLRTVALTGGQATLRLAAKHMRNKSIEIAYAGDAEFTSSTVTLPTMTPRALTRLPRPMIARRHRT